MVSPMNRKQLTVLWIGIGFAVLLALCPPWVLFGTRWGAPHEERFRHVFILGLPQTDGGDRFRLDTPVLVLEGVALALVVAGLLVTFKDR